MVKLNELRLELLLPTPTTKPNLVEAFYGLPVWRLKQVLGYRDYHDEDGNIFGSFYNIAEALQLVYTDGSKTGAGVGAGVNCTKSDINCM